MATQVQVQVQQAPSLSMTASTVSAKPKPVRALPASWYRSQEIYDLERRAIFSKKWMLATHSIRLPSPGDSLKYEVAGFEFVVARDAEGSIHGYRQIQEEGQAEASDHTDIASQTVKIHTRIDHNGFVWVNLDRSGTPEIAWDDDFAGIDRQARFEIHNFDEFRFDHAWEIEGQFNWKVLVDNYNECYHCQTAHPDVRALANLEAYSVDTIRGSIIHYANPDANKVDPSNRVASTFYLPNASMTVSPHFCFIQRLVPTSPTTSFLKYEVYRNKNSGDEEFEYINAMFKRIMNEDKWLCNGTQKNLNGGIFVNGELHPRTEKGPIYFQSVVRRLLKEHHDREVQLGHEIWPAGQN